MNGVWLASALALVAITCCAVLLRAARGARSLRITAGPRAGARIQLPPPGVRIGRNASRCEIVLGEPSVSRIHAEIRVEGRTLSLRHLSSTNPTWVNGSTVETATLRVGDELRIGESRLRVE